MSPGGLGLHANRVPVGAMRALPFGYVSQGRVRRLRTMLLAFVLISAAALLGDLVDLAVLAEAHRAHFLSDVDAHMLEVRGLMTRSLHALAFLGCALVFSRFLVQANRNAAFLGAGLPTVAPSSMVLWFFVPLANFWRPYHAVRELWWMSTAKTRREDPIACLPAWWASWIVGLVVMLFAFGLAEDAVTPADWIDVAVVDFAGKLALVVAAVLMIRWTRTLSERQDHARAEHICELAELR
jgi:hypothetical protein